MPLKYYYDMMSQPSRAVYVFLKVNNVEFISQPVALRKGEHFSEDFKKNVNPLSRVPVLIDDEFRLTESIAICKYIIQKYNLSDHWFPQSDLKAQARVEEFLQWHHLNIRAHCAILFRELLITPRATGNPVDKKAVDKMRKEAVKIIRKMDNYFLGNGNSYLAGSRLSLADLFGINELIQLDAVREEGLYQQFPRIVEWMDRVKQDTSPYFQEASQIVNRTRQAYSSLSAKL